MKFNQVKKSLLLCLICCLKHLTCSFCLSTELWSNIGLLWKRKPSPGDLFNCWIMSECISKLNGLLITSELGVKPVFWWRDDVGVMGKTVSSWSLRCVVMMYGLLVAAVWTNTISFTYVDFFCFLIYLVKCKHWNYIIKSVVFILYAVASSCKEVHYKTRLHVAVNLLANSLRYDRHLAWLHHHCCRPCVYVPTSKNTSITMRKSIHGFLLLSCMGMVLRLSARAPL